MSTILKVLNFTKHATSLCCGVAKKTLSQVQWHSLMNRTQHQQCTFASAWMVGGGASRTLHTSGVNRDLMEFFDDPKNWPESEVRVGRAWKKDELRIKSNKELHQLWYILLKERNMLLTMEHECNDKMEMFPSPERMDKVNISMRHLEEVVRERNKAYHLLETGVTGERPTRMVSSNLGLRYKYKACEHVLPPHMNLKWIKSRSIGYGGYAVRKFLKLYREKLYNVKRKAKNRSRNEVMMLLRRNPNFDMEVLRRKYPDVNINKLIRDDKIRGHFVPKIGV